MKTNIKFKKIYKTRLNQERLRNKAINRGVNILAPETIFLCEDTHFGKNVTVEPYVVFGPRVKIGNNVIIKSFSHIEGANIKDNISIGPYSRIRPGTKLESGTRIGNFVETKNSKVGNNSKVNHLTYIGDTIIGKNSNVGAGTITCNYDGANKHRTVIGDDAFIGSGTELVAPVTVGAGATIGAGSTIGSDAPAQQLTLTRVFFCG